MLSVCVVTACLAISIDTIFYNPDTLTFVELLKNITITPLNNLRYNSIPSNLAEHGIHPRYQHLVANLPQLLGPSFLLIFFSVKRTVQFWAAVSATTLLSLFQHQEPRFLLPVVPLILSSVRIPRKFFRMWVAVWLIFNIFMGVLMGIYHQGGVVPVQMFLAGEGNANLAQVLWWKTYSPPTWLLDGKNREMITKDLMGITGEVMVEKLKEVAACTGATNATETYLVAPKSATYVDGFTRDSEGKPQELRLEQVWSYNKHLNLDDLDFAEAGIQSTLERVIGRRGLLVWRVERICE